MWILFDCDGMLADTFNIFREAFHDAARRLQTTLYRRHDEAYIRTLEASDVLRYHGVMESDIPAFARMLREGMDARHDQVSMFPGIQEVLEELRGRGHQLGIVSSNSVHSIEEALSPVLRLFQSRITDVGLLSRGRVLRQTADAVSDGLQTCYIGDEIRDLRASRAAAIDFAAVTWGYNTEEALRKAGCDVLIRQPREIVTFIESRTQKAR